MSRHSTACKVYVLLANVAVSSETNIIRIILYVCVGNEKMKCYIRITRMFLYSMFGNKNKKKPIHCSQVYVRKCNENKLFYCATIIDEHCVADADDDRV